MFIANRVEVDTWHTEEDVEYLGVEMQVETYFFSNELAFFRTCEPAEMARTYLKCQVWSRILVVKGQFSAL